MAHIDVLRHGEVFGGCCYRGITDDPLTTLGWQQMQTAVAHKRWDVIISSPLLRCRAFAEKLSVDLALPLVFLPDLQEINFGAWEGLTAAEIDADALAQFYTDPENFTPPDAESFNSFKQRVLMAWQMILQDYREQTILLVTHGGVIRVILAEVLGLNFSKSFNLEIAYGCLSRLQVFNTQNSEAFVQLKQHGVLE